MKDVWKTIALLAIVLGLGGGVAQAQSESGESSGPRLLSLQASTVLDGLEKAHVDMPLAARLPDFRLKVVQPDIMGINSQWLEPQLRGIELQLPRSGIWVGYDWSSEGEVPRATFSIQHDF